jgi:hypothetical protein
MVGFVLGRSPEHLNPDAPGAEHDQRRSRHDEPPRRHTLVRFIGLVEGFDGPKALGFVVKLYELWHGVPFLERG